MTRALNVLLTSTTLFIVSFNANAYLDPGSGSMILQMIVGGIVGLAIAIKTYWFKIKDLISNIFNKK